MTGPRRIRPRDYGMSAYTLTEDNAVQVAEWCGGEVREARLGHDGSTRCYVAIPPEQEFVCVDQDFKSRTYEKVLPTPAFPGDTIIRGTTGRYFVRSKFMFELEYEDAP